MTTSIKAVNAATRDEFSERLLKGSVKKSYAPIVDIDWDTPLDPDKFYLPPKTVSLYGTALWDSMSREEQIELSARSWSTPCRRASGSRTSSTRPCCAR